MSKAMIIHSIHFVTIHILSSQALVNGTKLSANIHYRVLFDVSCKVRNEPNPTNSMRPAHIVQYALEPVAAYSVLAIYSA